MSSKAILATLRFGISPNNIRRTDKWLKHQGTPILTYLQVIMLVLCGGDSVLVPTSVAELSRGINKAIMVYVLGTC